MTTLQQQVEHFRDYWKVPQEDIDSLIELAIVDYRAKQTIKQNERLNKFVSEMKAKGNYSAEYKELDWGKPVGEEVW